MFQFQSSNPALNNKNAFSEVYGKNMFADKANVTTMSGVINKTALLIAIAVASGAGGYALVQSMPSILYISAGASFIIVLGFYFLLAGKPQLAPIVAPIFAVVEGVFLGALTAMVDGILKSKGLDFIGGVGLQAFVITGSCVGSMLFAYRTGLIKPTRTFQAVLFTLGGAAMLAYLVSFIMMMVWGKQLPLIGFASAVNDHGMMGYLGLGINVFMLVLASLFLILDFKFIEDKVKAGAPKYMEWYCGFALLVTIAWIYIEAVKLVLRLSVLFGGRD